MFVQIFLRVFERQAAHAEKLSSAHTCQLAGQKATHILDHAVVNTPVVHDRRKIAAMVISIIIIIVVVVESIYGSIKS